MNPAYSWCCYYFDRNVFKSAILKKTQGFAGGNQNLKTLYYDAVWVKITRKVARLL
jgi:hypothetical protein